MLVFRTSHFIAVRFRKHRHLRHSLSGSFWPIWRQRRSWTWWISATCELWFIFCFDLQVIFVWFSSGLCRISRHLILEKIKKRFKCFLFSTMRSNSRPGIWGHGFDDPLGRHSAKIFASLIVPQLLLWGSASFKGKEVIRKVNISFITLSSISWRTTAPQVELILLLRLIFFEKFNKNQTVLSQTGCKIFELWKDRVIHETMSFSVPVRC